MTPKYYKLADSLKAIEPAFNEPAGEAWHAWRGLCEATARLVARMTGNGAHHAEFMACCGL